MVISLLCNLQTKAYTDRNLTGKQKEWEGEIKGTTQTGEKKRLGRKEERKNRDNTGVQCGKRVRTRGESSLFLCLPLSRF